MSELLFEIGTEEIPAGYIAPALRSMQETIRRVLQGLGLDFSSVQTAGTPRRLVLCIDGLPVRQEDREVEHVGPPLKAAFDSTGAPSRAAEGFARSRGLQVSELQRTVTEKGEYLVARERISGRATAELLPEVLASLVTSVSFPKSMRWGNGTLTFARPIQWLLAIHAGQPVQVRVDNLVSGDTSQGHRFLANTAFAVRNWLDYREQLQQHHVLVDPSERRLRVEGEVYRAVVMSQAGSGARPLIDPGLLDTVTNLVEEPFAVCGCFDPAFLELPSEVLITSMREHQKYFPVVDGSGTLLPFFVAVNNTRVNDLALAASGHERVLRARLEDALFFYREDRKKPLRDWQVGLSGIIFQNRLGTMLEKSQRVAALAAHIASFLAPGREEEVRRAAILAKCDLLSAMVGEFPSLQGIMGREYALADGEAAEVAAAVAEHYMPLRAGSELPDGLLGIMVGLADRMDTLVGCFGIGEKPTGTTDPFGLRRQAIGLLRILDGKSLSLSLRDLAGQAIQGYAGQVELAAGTLEGVLEFLRLRLANDLVAGGLLASAVEAALAVAFDDVPDCRSRINALEEISGREQFGMLAGSCKRIRNIIKDNRATRIDPALLQAPEEEGLARVFASVREEVATLLAARQYPEALDAMLRIKEPLDVFFDRVMVMSDDQALRQNRLNLLTALGDLLLQVGDIAKMSS